MCISYRIICILSGMAGYVGRNFPANNVFKKKKEKNPCYWDAYQFNIFRSISLDNSNIANDSSEPERKGLAACRNQ